MPDVPPKADRRSIHPDARVGTLFGGKWRIDRLLDVGGMGAVYAATHRNGRTAAIKVLHQVYARDANVRRRFQLEGYVANKIAHPGAVAILDDDTTDDGAPYLVMELLDGESLAARLARPGDRLAVADALAICGQVLEALKVAHAAEILHRDIKPGNVFLTRTGHAKLLDFGLARVRVGTQSLVPTAYGLALGTAGYMPPEQANGMRDEVDVRSDLFSVGAVLFRAIAGRRVHELDDPMETLKAAMREPAPPLGSVAPEAGPRLRHAIDKALAFRKRERWAGAQEMLDALRAAYAEVRAGVGAGVAPGAGAARSEEPSLVVEVTFGDEHDEAMERERKRTLDVIDQASHDGPARRRPAP